MKQRGLWDRLHNVAEGVVGQVTQCSRGGCGTGYTMKQRGLMQTKLYSCKLLLKSRARMRVGGH